MHGSPGRTRPGYAKSQFLIATDSGHTGANVWRCSEVEPLAPLVVLSVEVSHGSQPAPELLGNVRLGVVPVQALVLVQPGPQRVAQTIGIFEPVRGEVRALSRVFA